METMEQIEMVEKVLFNQARPALKLKLSKGKVGSTCSLILVAKLGFFAAISTSGFTFLLAGDINISDMLPPP